MEKVDIALVLEHYGAENVPHGNKWRAMRCPFHGDRQASASVHTDRGSFKCFVCDVRGDGLDIIQHQEGGDFASAVTFAETVFGASVGDVLRQSQGRSRRQRLSDDTAPVRGQRTIVSTRVRRKPITGA